MSQPLQAPLQTPWHVHALLPASAPGTPYHIIDAHPQDISRVVTWYQVKPVPGYDIRSVRIIHNPQMGRMFQGRVDLLEQRHASPAFSPKWQQESKTPAEKNHRTQTHALFQQITTSHHYPDAPHTHLLPMWHGTDPTILDSIFKTGYANLATTDAGFFGKGLYNAYDPEYAHRVYSKGALLINFVATYSVYPVIDGDMPKLQGKGNYQNYDAHFIPVTPKNPNNPHEVNYYPCKPNQTPTYLELVVFDPAQVLPRYIVELGPTLIVHPTPPASSLQVTHLLALLVEYQLTLEPHDTAYDLIDHQIIHYGSHNGLLNPQETSLYNLVKRISGTTDPTLKAPFAKKVTLLLGQLNNPQTTPPAGPAVQPAPQPSPHPLPKIQAPTPNPVILQKPPQPALPPIAFGKAKWAQYFGDVGVEPPLPANIHEILNSPCPIFPGKRVYEMHLLTLIPQTINGQPLTLQKLGELVQKPLQGPATKYRYFDIGNYQDQPMPRSHWTLLTRDVIPNSTSKKYAAQQQVAAAYGGYEIPNVLDTTVTLFMEHVQSGTRLYKGMYIRCQEKYNYSYQLAVGGFAAGGLYVVHCDGNEDDNVGVVLSRKFF